MNKCLCIKDGFMSDDEQFCKKGEWYDYEGDDEHSFCVDAPKKGSVHHTMYKKFFHTYFMIKKPTMRELLE
jgi:hypothetical protein